MYNRLGIRPFSNYVTRCIWGHKQSLYSTITITSHYTIRITTNRLEFSLYNNNLLQVERTKSKCRSPANLVVNRRVFFAMADKELSTELVAIDYRQKQFINFLYGYLVKPTAQPTHHNSMSTHVKSRSPRDNFAVMPVLVKPWGLQYETCRCS